MTQYRQGQLITVKQALELIESNHVIVSGMVSAEPKLILQSLHEIAGRVTNVTVTNCLPMAPTEFDTDEAYKDSFNVASWFFSNAQRKSHSHGNISFIPNHLHLACKNRLEFVKPDIYIGSASMPDKHGYVSLSVSNVYEKNMLQAAKTVILEINPNFPRTFGDTEVHLDEIDYVIECDYPVTELPDIEPNEKDLIIGKQIADYIQDGDCIQLGIGGIPNAVAASLKNKKDLGVHTEMFTTGLMKLAKAGAISGKYKTTHTGKMVACFALGNRELYDYLDDNPSILILDGNYVNDPYIIGLNDRQISINSTIEIDLTGQCCSESLGSKQFSGTGGQADTAIGAQRSKNGMSFIALYSTAMVTNHETGQKEEVSKIVAQLKLGAAVSLSRNDVDYVVTEYGVAALRGTTVNERVRRLIEIAHPKFREQLLVDAKKAGII